jgi:hypothetical protein
VLMGSSPERKGKGGGEEGQGTRLGATAEERESCRRGAGLSVVCEKEGGRRKSEEKKRKEEGKGKKKKKKRKRKIFLNLEISEKNKR